MVCALVAEGCAQHLPWRGEPAVSRGLAGVVFDSLAGAPLDSATVDIVDATHPEARESETMTDARGAYALPGLGPGKYVATFHHPRLDSLRVRAASTRVDVGATRGTWLELATPSLEHVFEVACGAVPDQETGVLVGRVLHAETRAPAPQAVVVAQWMDITVTPIVWVYREWRSGKGLTTAHSSCAACRQARI